MAKKEMEMGSKDINPIIEKLYDLYEEENYQPIHMLMASYMFAESLASGMKLTEETREGFVLFAREKCKDIRWVLSDKNKDMVK